MSKDKFNNIKITTGHLQKVGGFRGIVAPGRTRPTLSKEEHEALVQTKYDSAGAMEDHITLFRVKDKKGLPPKEQNNHTVPGPVWTLPSSVGFVIGAQSKGHRIWSATEVTDDNDCLLGDRGEPAILARESMAAVIGGWMAREPQQNEKYGKTDRRPYVVFTPPASPRDTSAEDLKNIMDVKANWENLPMSLNQLIWLSTPISKGLTDFFKRIGLSREDFDDSLITRIDEHDIALTDLDCYDMLLAFTTDEALSFFKEYGEDIDVVRIAEIYRDNPDLFYALINDEDKLLHDIGVEYFITKYQNAQYITPDDDPYYSEYDMIRRQIARRWLSR